MLGFFKKTDPLWEQFSEEANRKAQFTPDIEDVQDKYCHNVFIYNECQSHGPKNNVINGSVYGGHSYTESSDYVLYKKLLAKETYPFAFEITDDEKLGRSSYIGDMGQIMGELWLIRPNDLIALDNYMLNTVQFDRKRVKIVVPFHADEQSPVDVHTIEAWMYVAKKKFWSPQIADAQAKKFFRRSSRLFCTKDNNNKDTLSAYYIFDYDAELETSAF